MWKMLFGDVFERREFVDAGVVDEHVEAAVGFFGFGEEAGDVGLFGDVGLDGDGFAAVGGDFGDDFVGAGFAGGVVDDDGGAFGGERFGDGCADAFGGAGDDRDLIFEFGHLSSPLRSAVGCYLCTVGYETILLRRRVSRTFLPLDTKQCDKMLEYEKGYKKEKAGPPARYPQRTRRPEGAISGGRGLLTRIRRWRRRCGCFGGRGMRGRRFRI